MSQLRKSSRTVSHLRNYSCARTYAQTILAYRTSTAIRQKFPSPHPPGENEDFKNLEDCRDLRGFFTESASSVDRRQQGPARLPSVPSDSAFLRYLSASRSALLRT